MPIGERQLQVMLNLASQYPNRRQSKQCFEGRYEIGWQSRSNNLMSRLRDRNLIDDEPETYKHATDRVKAHAWQLTILGWYHLVNLESHLGLWDKRARKFWREHVKKAINKWLPVDVKEALVDYEPTPMIQLTNAETNSLPVLHYAHILQREVSLEFKDGQFIAECDVAEGKGTTARAALEDLKENVTGRKSVYNPDRFPKRESHKREVTQ